MGFANWYWIGSGVPYASYLRQKDIAMQGAAPVVAAVSEQTREFVTALNGVRDEIAAVDRTLHWGFSSMLLALGSMGATLKELLKAVKTPAQTAAFEQFDIARDCARRGLFAEALEAIQAALDGNGASPGYRMEWRFHFLDGTLRLGSFENHDPAIVDLQRAEDSFLTAARYARVDFPRDAARAMTAASWACLVRSAGDPTGLARACDHAQEAIGLWRGQDDESDQDGCAEAHYQLAKASAASGKLREMRTSLTAAFTRCYGFVERATSDGDVACHGEVNEAVQDFVAARRAWLRAEFDRRLALADRAGMNDGNTAGALSRLRAMSDTAPPEAVLRLVRQGHAPVLSKLAEEPWNEAVRVSVPGFFVHVEGDRHFGDSQLTTTQFREFRWRDIEASVNRGALFSITTNSSGEEADGSARFRAVIDGVPVLGARVELTVAASFACDVKEVTPWHHSVVVGTQGVHVQFDDGDFEATLSQNGRRRYRLRRPFYKDGAGPFLFSLQPVQVVIIGPSDNIQTVVIFGAGNSADTPPRLFTEPTEARGSNFGRVVISDPVMRVLERRSREAEAPATPEALKARLNEHGLGLFFGTPVLAVLWLTWVTIIVEKPGMHPAEPFAGVVLGALSVALRKGFVMYAARSEELRRATRRERVGGTVKRRKARTHPGPIVEVAPTLPAEVADGRLDD